MPPSTPHVLTASGGCLCGALRYRVDGEFVDAGYCHCRVCQQASGAPVVAWFTVPVASFAWTRGIPRAYASSPQWQRESCARCGSQLVFRRQQSPIHIDVTIASLDDPGCVLPQYHIWRMSRLPWFEISDTLPRHDDSGPDQT